jgi:hypothetical protein
MLAKTGSFTTALVINSMAPSLARAEYSCGPAQWYNGAQVRSCTVGFDNIPLRTARQKCDQWCWAACIEAAFRLKDSNYKVSQERIVKKLFGSPDVCSPAIGPQIAEAIEGYWESDDGDDEFYATSSVHLDVQFGIMDPFALQNASRYLAQDIPIIVGALGHATLLTSMSWLEDSFGQYRPTEMIVRDPWRGNPNRRQLTSSEFFGTTYMAAVLVD